MAITEFAIDIRACLDSQINEWTLPGKQITYSLGLLLPTRSSEGGIFGAFGVGKKLFPADSQSIPPVAGPILQIPPTTDVECRHR